MLAMTLKRRAMTLGRHAMTLFADDTTLAQRAAGVDEVGRGPLAGPVYAAAVILDPTRPIEGLKDSKQLEPVERESLCEVIERDALAVAVAFADVEEIDRLNILRASLLAMQRAVAALRIVPEVVYVDGRERPFLEVPVVAIIGGDATVAAISAASIVAKVHRDREMCRLSLEYPGYGFEQHKGYATRAHLKSLAALGPTPLHRRSFAPVRLAEEGEAADLITAIPSSAPALPSSVPAIPSSVPALPATS
jgi:ribonuclease HII